MSAIGNFFKNLFSKLLGIFKAFINEAFTVASQILIAEGKELAIAIITQLATSNLSSAEKREEAWKQIQVKMKESGKEVSESLARTLSELAYQYYQNNLKK